MTHIAPTSHRSKPTSHRSAPGDCPIQNTTWLGLTFGLILGLVLLARSHVGVRAAGVTLLVMLVPLTIAVFASGIRRGLGSKRAAFATCAALSLVLLRFTFFA